MSAVFLDTSAFLAALLDEPQGQAVRKVLRESEEVYASNLLEAEARSALAREHAPAEHLAAGFAQISWVMPDRPLSVEMEELQVHGPLRGADMYHLACALYLTGTGERVAVLTLDRAQAKVAAAAGFEVRGPRLTA